MQQAWCVVLLLRILQYKLTMTLKQQGCNIPDIEVVVQWKLPTSLSSFIQRAGRAARMLGSQGLAVLLVEKTAYAEDVDALLAEKVKKRKKNERKLTNRELAERRKARLAYANLHGVSRGACGGKKDDILLKVQPALDLDLPNECLYTFVQTGCCRRKVLTAVFNNKELPSQ